MNRFCSFLQIKEQSLFFPRQEETWGRAISFLKTDLDFLAVFRGVCIIPHRVWTAAHYIVICRCCDCCAFVCCFFSSFLLKNNLAVYGFIIFKSIIYHTFGKLNIASQMCTFCSFVLVSYLRRNNPSLKWKGSNINGCRDCIKIPPSPFCLYWTPIGFTTSRQIYCTCCTCSQCRMLDMYKRGPWWHPGLALPFHSFGFNTQSNQLASQGQEIIPVYLTLWLNTFVYSSEFLGCALMRDSCRTFFFAEQVFFSSWIKCGPPEQNVLVLFDWHLK